MTTLNVIILVLGAIVALTGFDGEKVVRKTDAPPEQSSLWRRIRWRGWVYLFSLLAVLALNIHKELESLERHLRQGYPRFYELVADVTGYQKEEWTELFSYRLSMRLMLQKIYRESAGSHPPESIAQMLKDLGLREVIPEPLCARLDALRYHTYASEWGAAGGQPKPTVRPTEHEAKAALAELAVLVPDAKRASVKKAVTSCGTNPPGAA